jgi:hypothetical protein
MNPSAPRLFSVSLTLLLGAALPLHADDWPQWRGPLRDGVWRETGILERFPPEKLPVRWRTAVGPGFSGPAVADGRVFLMDRAVDQDAAADVKTQWNYRDKTTGRERVVCLDEATGKELWKAGSASEPGYCAPLIRTLGGQRQLVVWLADALMGLEPETGRVRWTKPRPRWNKWLICLVSMAAVAAVIACVALSYPPAAIVVTAVFLFFGLRFLLFVKVMTSKTKKRDP